MLYLLLFYRLLLLLLLHGLLRGLAVALAHRLFQTQRRQLTRNGLLVSQAWNQIEIEHLLARRVGALVGAAVVCGLLCPNGLVAHNRLA